MPICDCADLRALQLALTKGRQEISMTSIRKFVFATLLALTTVSFLPTLASAEGPAHGEFKLTHDVRWQNAMVPAGDYQFTYEADGASGVLTLSKLNGTRAGFIFLVSDTDDAAPSGASQLVIERWSDGSYVKTMQLSEYSTTLHFTVPTHAEKQIAQAATTAATSGQ
jgi:hypothetical protein